MLKLMNNLTKLKKYLMMAWKIIQKELRFWQGELHCLEKKENMMSQLQLIKKVYWRMEFKKLEINLKPLLNWKKKNKIKNISILS